MSNDFPRMLYRHPGREQMHGSTFDTRIVADEAEQDDAMFHGWHLTTSAAKEAATQPVASVAPVVDDNAPPTRDELKQKATELGIEFPSNIPTDKLSALIEEALKAKE